MLPPLQPLSLDHQFPIEAILRRYPVEISELTFTNLFIWRHNYRFEVAFHQGFLTLLAHPPDQAPFFFPPVGEGDLGSWAADCFAYLRERHYPPRMGRVPASQAENIASFPGHRKTLDRDNSDYVYLTDNLIRLSGNRYHTYKNHRNRFMKQHAWDYQPLTPNLIGECLNLQEEWCRLRQCFESPSLLSEEQAIIEAFTHLDRLMFKGGVIRVNNKVEAFTLGELLNPKTVVIHFEKANPDLSGLYQVIQQQFLEREWKGIPLVNREQDLGLEGLRKAKQSYHPEFLVEKYSLFLDS